jgi:hypothetical protein
MNMSQDRSSVRLPEKLSRLFREVKEDRGRIEDARLAATGTFGVRDRRNFAIGIDGAEGGRVLLAFARVDGYDFVGQARLFEEKGDLGGIGRWVEVETDHRFGLAGWRDCRLGPGGEEHPENDDRDR